MNNVRPAAERTQGACQPVTSAYSHAACTVTNSAIPSGTKQIRNKNRKNAASTATCVPEITSA
jgi:hypothetical protein